MSENNTSIESERRIATVMFADISGFTAMSEKMDPEQVTCVMNDCFCMMGECIDKYGGTIGRIRRQSCHGALRCAGSPGGCSSESGEHRY